MAPPPRLKREAIVPGDYLGIRFRPGMARFFVDLPAEALTNRREPVSGQLAIDMAPFCERIASADVFARLDRALERHLALCDPRICAIDTATRSISACNGAVRIEELARALGKSRRQLERQFLQAVGIGAKQFAVIARFRHARARLAARPAQSLAALAVETGYADRAYPLWDEAWGQRRFGLLDPSGMWVDVVQQIEPAPGYWDTYITR